MSEVRGAADVAGDAVNCTLYLIGLEPRSRGGQISRHAMMNIGHLAHVEGLLIVLLESSCKKSL